MDQEKRTGAGQQMPSKDDGTKKEAQKKKDENKDKMGRAKHRALGSRAPSTSGSSGAPLRAADD